MCGAPVEVKLRVKSGAAAVGVARRASRPPASSTTSLPRSVKHRAAGRAQELLAEQQQQQQQHISSGMAVCSSHPDAIRRRIEQLEWQRQRQEERAAERWHQAPSSLVTCKSPDQYRHLVQQAARENKLLVAKFFTEECYVCKSLFPKVRKIAAENSDVLWAKINGSDPEMVNLFNSLGISKVPVFHMVRNGELVAELHTSLSPEKLAAFRAELAAQKPTTASSAKSSSSSGGGDDQSAAGMMGEAMPQLAVS